MGSLKNGQAKSCGCLQKENYFPTIIRKRNYQKASINAQYRTYKGNARKKDRLYLNQEEWFKIASKPCVYCGEIDVRKGVIFNEKGLLSEEDIKKSQVLINGIDRIDSTKGYIKDNMAPCCGWCNTMKREKTHEEFILKIKKIYDFLSPSSK